MKPPKFGSIRQYTINPPSKAVVEQIKHIVATGTWNAEHEERAAIHEFDGGCTRAEAEARAAAECQHCGHVKPLEPVNKASYGHGLDVCAKCAVELVAKGWTLGKSYVEGKVW